MLDIICALEAVQAAPIIVVFQQPLLAGCIRLAQTGYQLP